MANKSKFNHITKEELENLYHNYGSLTATAKHFNCGIKVIRRLIKKFDIRPNPRNRRKYNVDDNFFARDNEASFYWAGFIAADGNSKKTRNCLTVKLSLKDLDHLLKFKADIKSENPIRIYQNKPINFSDEKLEYCEIAISSHQIINDLLKFNIIPAKTKIYSFPEWLIDHPLVHHFMRGYVDGDGSFYQESNDNSIKFSLCGNNWFVNIFKNILTKNNVLLLSGEGKFSRRKKFVRELDNNGFASINYGGNLILERIKNYLYKDASIFMERKLAIANKATSLKVKKQPPTYEGLKKSYDKYGYNISAISKELKYNWRTIKNYLNFYNFSKGE